MFTKTKKLTTIFALAIMLVMSFALLISVNMITAYSAQSEYTVTFYHQNGKTIKTETVQSGATVKKQYPQIERDGAYFSHWTDANGNEFDFSKPINSNTNLYARYTYDDAFILADLKGSTIYDYAEEQTNLVALNGADNKTTVNDPYNVTQLDFDTDGNAVYYVGSYSFIKYPSIRFNAGINVNQIDNITLRIYVNVSKQGTLIDNSVGGFAVAGIDSTGNVGECITLPSDIKQDKWIDFTLNRYQAQTLANENGQINGLAFISNFKYDPNNPPTDGSTVIPGGLEYKEICGYVKLDYVTYDSINTENALVAMYPENGDSPVYQFVKKNSALDLSFVPEKLGYEFSGWMLSNGLPLEKDTLITSDMVLYAEYNKLGDRVVITLNDNLGNVTEIEWQKNTAFVEPESPFRIDHEFVCWTDERGMPYDFSNNVTDDLKLSASYRKTTGNVLVDFSADYYCGETKLQALNGYDNYTTPRNDEYKSDIIVVKDGWNSQIKYPIGSWGFTKYPTVYFAPIEVSKIKSLTIKMLVHVYDGEIDDRYGGFAFSSVDSYGDVGTCLQIPSNIVQDNWVDFTISPVDAKLLADDNGYISGLSAISNFKYDVNVNPTTNGSGVFIGAPNINDKAFIIVDSVSYELRDENSVALYVNAGNGEQTDIQFVNKNVAITRPQNPVKQGYEFLEWVDETGSAFNFTNGIKKDTTIYARYKTQNGILLTDFTSDYSVANTKLLSLNGQSNATVGNDKYQTPFTVQTVNGVSYAKYPVHCWGYMQFPTVTFPKISVQSLKSLKLRIYVHLNDGLIDNTFGGFAFAGATATGVTGECFVIPSATVQDQWIDFEISAFDLEKLADKDGYISGIAVVASFKQDNAIRDKDGQPLIENGQVVPNYKDPGVYPFGSTDPRSGYVLIDSITCQTRQNGELAVSINESNGTNPVVQYVTEGQTISLSTPVKNGCDFIKWVDEHGNTVDSTTQIIEDTRIFAVYKQRESGLNLLVDFTGDYITGEHTLKYINGYDRAEYYTSFSILQIDRGITVKTDNGVTYGEFRTNNYGSVTYPAIKFLSPVSLNEIDYLTIRLYVHLYDGLYDTSIGGVVLCGMSGSGLKSECYMIPEGVKQDEWIDIVMTRSEASIFANSQGVIDGIVIGSMFRYDPAKQSSKGVYVGDDGYAGYISVDYVAYKQLGSSNDTLKQKITFNGYQTETVVYVDKYAKATAPIQVPVKDGYKFAYWAYAGKAFDFEKTSITQDLVLDPVFVYDYATDYSYVGVYTNGNRTIVLNSNNNLKIYENQTLMQSCACAVLVNGKVMVDGQTFAIYDGTSDKLTIGDTAYNRGGGYVITFVTNGGQALNKLAFVGNILPTLPETYIDNGLFDGWYKDNGLTQEVKTGDAVSSDVTLYAKYDTSVVLVTLNYVDGKTEKTSSVVVKIGEKLAVDFLPEKENSIFSHWVYPNGEKFDAETIINFSIELTACYTQTQEYLVKADKIIGKNNGSLQMIDGLRYYNADGTDGTNIVEIQRIENDGASTGYAYKIAFHSWNVTLSSNAITFDKAVKVADIDGLTVRMYAYLSPSSNYDVQSGGIKLFGLTNTGDIGEGVMLPANVKQKEWFDFYLSKSDCEKMSDEDGMLSGLQIASRILSPEINSQTAYEGLGAMYLLIDYVAVTEKVEVTFALGEETYRFDYNKGDKLQTKYLTPEKDGYMFAGWVDGNDAVVGKDFVITEPINLTARWIERQPVSNVQGYYMNGDGNVIVISDVIEINFGIKYDDVCYCDGKVYLFHNGNVTVCDLDDYAKLETIKVTYDYGYDKETLIYPKNTIITPLDLSGRINGFKGWEDASKNPVNFAIGFSTDVTVYAVIDWSEVSDYTPYAGWYKFENEIIKLTAGKKITVNGVTTDYTIKDGILSYTVNGKTEHATINGFGIIINEQSYLKLNSVVSVTFSTGNIAREPAKIDVSINDNYVMTVKLHEVSADGYNFLGWYDADGNKVEENATYYESAKLYAKWERITEPEQSSGCSSSIAYGYESLAVLLVVAVAIVIKRRKEV